MKVNFIIPFFMELVMLSYIIILSNGSFITDKIYKKKTVHIRGKVS